MIFLKINGKKYKCKNTMELSIDEFTDLSKKLSNEVTAEGITKTLLNELSNIPKHLLKHIKTESLLTIDISNILTAKNIENTIDFDEFAFGKVIDIEQFLINEDQQRATARILLPNETTPKELDNFRTVKTHEAINYLGFYNEWKIELFKNYSNIVSTGTYTEEKDKSNAWIDLLSKLCMSVLDQDKISEMRFTKILFYLNGKNNENLKTN